MITGNRIRLRAVEVEDLPQFVYWLNDPEVTEGLQIYSPLSLGEEKIWYENMLKRAQDERPLVIEARDEDGGWIMIGNCGFFNIDWRCRSAEIGIFIGNKAFWNQGFGTEAIRLMIAYGFRTLNLNRIMLEVYETNQRAIRSYEKAGFVCEGRKRQAMYKNGAYCDVLIMSVLKQDWDETDA